MSGDLLDLVLGFLAVVFAVSGFRQGVVAGFLSLLGFFGGGVLGAQVSPAVSSALAEPGTGQSMVAVACVFVAAALGQLLASAIGYALRERIRWQSARAVDSACGSLLSVVALLLVAWLVGTAVVQAPFPTLSHQVKHSAILRMVDGIIPDVARSWFSEFRRAVGQSAFPQVFGGLGPDRTVEVSPPDPEVADNPGVKRALRSVVKVEGVAPQCSRTIDGSGFIYAPQHVMTNAHVVAGVRGGPEVMVGGESHRARVVLFDERRDVAVLYVPGLRRASLPFDGEARQGGNAVVAGHPGGGPLTVGGARIRSKENARGPDIYQHTETIREVYSIRATVRPGNSGGPLLTPSGQVYGVVFAAAVDDPQTGYVLTADEVSSSARRARNATEPVSTKTCD
ncbi:MAG: MarP family serine protease [Streptosporangiales bacterium]|nr:MarP family serine protease [Streptosporangiales bacterium]